MNEEREISKKSFSISQWLLIIGIVAAAFVAGFFMTLKGRDAELESRVIEGIQTTMSGQDRATIDLSKLSDKTISVVCLQGPYAERKDFQKRIGRTFKTRVRWKDLEEDSFIWWMFFEDGTEAWIEVPRSLMDATDRQLLCSKPGKALVHVEKSASFIAYHF
ncbi:MAG: hypothetical protein IPH08_00145 [Rhodocyclaceae bacterium]|nr:hypothetical protein [Rhodocyclaceae bacterium]